jgi:hypothetical protein
VVNRDFATVNVNVYNSAGEVVRHLLTNDPMVLTGVIESLTLSTPEIVPGSNPPGPPGEVQITVNAGVSIPSWDGRNDSGTLVTTGTYFVSIVIVNQGTTSTLTQDVVVLNNGSNQAGGTVVASPDILRGMNQTVKFMIRTDQTLTLDVKIYDIAGERMAEVLGGSGQDEANWTATGIASGLYFAAVNLTDMAGNNLGRQVVKLAVIH